MKYLLLISFLCSLHQLLPAQQRQARFQTYSLDLSQGETLKHRPSMVFELPNPAREIRFEITASQNRLVAHYPHLKSGFGTLYLTYGNAEVLGSVWAVYGFVDQAFIRTKRFSILGRIDHGLAWNTRIFHPEENPLNNAMGTHLNLHASLGLKIEYPVSRQITLRGGGFFTHQSNSRISLPNLGLNGVKLTAGIAYQPQMPPDRSEEFVRKAKAFQVRKWQSVVKIGLGLKEPKGYQGPVFPIYIISAQAAYHIKNKRRYLIGLEGLWDTSRSQFRIDNAIPNDFPEWQSFRPSLALGHEYLFGRVALLTQTNFYLRNAFTTKDFWSVKVGTNIYLHSFYAGKKQNLFVGVYIKTHLAIADFLEFGLGYSF